MWHAHYLLCVGDEEAESSLLALGDVLGFGSIERDDFQWRGKRIRKCKDTGEIKISMVPYHQSLKPVVVGRERRKDPSALLTPGKIKPRAFWDRCNGWLLNYALISHVRYLYSNRRHRQCGHFATCEQMPGGDQEGL